MFWREPVFIAHTKMRPVNAYNKIFIYNFVILVRWEIKEFNLVSTLLVASEALRWSVEFIIRWQDLRRADFNLDPLALF